MTTVNGVERSAGVLVYRWASEPEPAPSGVAPPVLQVLLGHLGGPYWSRKDDGAWTIPKGLVESGEHDWAAARREFGEETGHPVPDGKVADLGVVQQNSSKEIHIWAVLGEIDATTCFSNLFELEWPPKSSQIREFPELDRFAWCDLGTAEVRMVKGQRPLLAALSALLGPPE